MTDWNQFVPVPRGALPVDLRRFRFRAGNYRASFEPRGDVRCFGNPATLRHKNPAERFDVVPLTARLFVGLNVGQVPTHTIDEVVRLTRAIRTEQGSPPDASFLAQRGLFTDERTKEIVEENSVQVVIFEFGREREPPERRQQRFEAEMEELGEKLARALDQQVIYVELQRAGIPYTVLRVTP